MNEDEVYYVGTALTAVPEISDSIDPHHSFDPRSSFVHRGVDNFKKN